MDRVVHLTHTPADTVNEVDARLLEETAEMVAGLIIVEHSSIPPSAAVVMPW